MTTTLCTRVRVRWSCAPPPRVCATARALTAPASPASSPARTTPRLDTHTRRLRSRRLRGASRPSRRLRLRGTTRSPPQPRWRSWWTSRHAGRNGWRRCPARAASSGRWPGSWTANLSFERARRRTNLSARRFKTRRGSRIFMTRPRSRCMKRVSFTTTRRFPRRSRTRSYPFKRRARWRETTTTSTTRPRRRRIRNEKRKRRFTSPRGGSRTHDWSPPTSSPPSPRSRRRVWSPRTHAPRAPWRRWSPGAARGAPRQPPRARALEPGPGGGRRRRRGGRDARCCRRARGDAGGDRERGGFEHGRIDLVHGSGCRNRARGGGGRAGSGV